MKLISVTINGQIQEVESRVRILDHFLKQGIVHPHICYSEIMGPIQTCDTCMVETNGHLVRACATEMEDGMLIETQSDRAKGAQAEAMDRILENHLLYCTVCDNNNGNCGVHNTAELLQVEHQTRPFSSKGYDKDMSNPFYRYDADQCILCGRCVEACQDLQVNRTVAA